MKDIAKKQLAKDQDYLLFIGIDENIVLNLKGVLNNIIEGNLILTDKKLFFYFRSNVSRDKVFIATYPYIFAVQLKEGFINSTLIIESKKESYAQR